MSRLITVGGQHDGRDLKHRPGLPSEPLGELQLQLQWQSDA